MRVLEFQYWIIIHMEGLGTLFLPRDFPYCDWICASCEEDICLNWFPVWAGTFCIVGFDIAGICCCLNCICGCLLLKLLNELLSIGNSDGASTLTWTIGLSCTTSIPTRVVDGWRLHILSIFCCCWKRHILGLCNMLHLLNLLHLHLWMHLSRNLYIHQTI